MSKARHYKPACILTPVVMSVCFGTLFSQVMKKLNECSCKEKLKSQRCGHGKFVIQPSTRDKKTTLYARVSYSREYLF